MAPTGWVAAFVEGSLLQARWQQWDLAVATVDVLALNAASGGN